MTDEELQRRVSAAYDGVLGEPVPDRLSKLLEPGKVVDLGARRGQKAAKQSEVLTWAHWGGIAAGVLVGIALGWQFAPRDDALVAQSAGSLVAGSKLARALDSQLAADAGDVAVQVTFKDREGRYCRTFTAQQAAGLACREGSHWAVVAMAQANPSPAGAMRQAGSALPRPVLDAVDARIAGGALDAAAEKRARDAVWAR